MEATSPPKTDLSPRSCLRCRQQGETSQNAEPGAPGFGVSTERAELPQGYLNTENEQHTEEHES